MLLERETEEKKKKSKK